MKPLNSLNISVAFFKAVGVKFMIGLLGLLSIFGCGDEGTDAGTVEKIVANLIEIFPPAGEIIDEAMPLTLTFDKPLTYRWRQCARWR